MNEACTVAGCPKPRLARGACDTHYWRLRKYGSTDLPPAPSLAERFWAKVDKSGDCWLWTGAQTKGGYGIMGVGGRGVSPEGAHRVAWNLAHGEIPDGLFVLHRCDVRLCVRSTHLFLGSQRENVRDMYGKGRAAAQTKPEVFLRGNQQSQAKLDPDKVRAIRERRAQGETLVSIAAAYGVTFGVVGRIAQRQLWKHVE